METLEKLNRQVKELQQKLRNRLNGSSGQRKVWRNHKRRLQKAINYIKQYNKTHNITSA